MNDVVIVEAVRSPIARRGGALATTHPAHLLGQVLAGLFQRVDLDPGGIGQVVCGCVSQVGEQSFNIGRTAWLTAGFPLHVPTTTVDTQCGSSQQAFNLAVSLVSAGVVDSAIACGVESMTRVPMGSNSRKELGLGLALPKSYFGRYEFTSQFEAAERIADKWNITREDTDRFAVLSQARAAASIAAGAFDSQMVPIGTPSIENPDDQPFCVDEGPRPTTMEGLASLTPVARPDGVHTAGSASQISDGASAVVVMSARRAFQLGLTPLARVVDTCLVGVDPVMMLTGPIDVTERLLGRTGWKIDDIDVIEINEAFASVVLAWERTVHPDPEAVNPNGGAIALGHPLGATGAMLLTKAVHGLCLRGGERAFVTMCCGGGLGTGTLLER